MIFATLRIIIFSIIILGVSTMRFSSISGPKPRLFGNAIGENALDTRYPKIRSNIVEYHNFFRSRVIPKASNMLEMSWHDGAARSALEWAEQCKFLVHGNLQNEEYRSCGQNIYIATHRVPWFFAIKMWFSEKSNFTFGSPSNDLMTVGHYTQMVWATSNKVGCGIAHCPSGAPLGKPFYNYVCNYCPTGNWQSKAFKPYKIGKSCSSCPGLCKKKKLCTNPCSYADQYNNCQEMMVTHGKGWICDQHGDVFESCKASCLCHDKIHEWQ